MRPKRLRSALGTIISELARRALRNPPGAASQVGASHDAAEHHVSERLAGYGIRPLPPRSGIVCNVLQIMSLPGYSSPQPLAVLIAMLQGSTATHFHHLHMHSHNQLTDLYLLALAVKNGVRLVSFDQRIPLSAVQGARAEHLVML